MHLKLLQIERLKKKVTGDLIGNKVADKIIKVSRTSPPSNLETNEEILKERCIS